MKNKIIYTIISTIYFNVTFGCNFQQIDVPFGLINTPLYMAVAKNDYNQVEKLLKQGVDPNTLDYNGISPLHEASADGYLDIIKLLVQYGADIYKESGTGYNAVEIAEVFNQKKVIEYFKTLE